MTIHERFNVNTSKNSIDPALKTYGEYFQK